MELGRHDGAGPGRSAGDPVVIRARGLLTSTCRFAGLVVFLAFAAAYLAGGVGPVVVAIVGVAVLVWEALLFRAGVKVDESGVAVRSPFGVEVVPLPTVRSFGAERRREPMDAVDRAVVLVIETTDGRQRICRWVAWQDFISPFLTSGAKRPLTLSQTQALDRLNAALSSAKDASTAA